MYFFEFVFGKSENEFSLENLVLQAVSINDNSKIGKNKKVRCMCNFMFFTSTINIGTFYTLRKTGDNVVKT